MFNGFTSYPQLARYIHCATALDEAEDSSHCSIQSQQAHPAALSPNGEIVAPFLLWQRLELTGSPANSKARSRHALHLLKIECFFCVSISCSSIPHDIFWLRPWSVTCTSGFREWQLNPELGGRLGILGRKIEASSADCEKGKKKRKIKVNICSQHPPFNSEALTT